MTLVELLVVLLILLLIAAATIPRLSPNIDRARVREAARSIQLYLSSARNQAIATGRSCGVMIERLPAEPGCSMSLTQVETPVPYSGDYSNSNGTVAQSSAPSGGYAYCNIALSSPTSVALHVGDQIRIGYQGYWITLITSSSGGAIPVGTTQLTGMVDISSGANPAWTVQPISGPYSIIRVPTKSAAASLQLPSPAAIDLTLSGDPVLASDPQVWGVYDKNPVMITFAPNGSVDKIYVTTTSGYSFSRATAPICLLVGRRDQVGAGATTTNLNDFNSLWVAVNPATGLTIVTDLASNSDPWASRAFARQSDAMGGK